MPTLEHSKAIEQYYEQVKDKYPDVDFKEFNVICRTPFNFMKTLIRGTRLPIIMVKHLGKFIPSVARVKKKLVAEKAYFDRGYTDEETYEKRRNFLQNFLNDSKNETSREVIDDLGESE
jgi:hypothetical protein